MDRQYSMHGANTFVLIIDFYKFNSLISVGFLFFLIEKNSYQIEILKKYENGKNIDIRHIRQAEIK